MLFIEQFFSKAAAPTSKKFLYTWGANSFGQLGTSLGNTEIKSWTAIQIGWSNAMAIRSDGAMFVWGNTGLTGAGLPATSASPVQVGTSSWTAISTKPLYTGTGNHWMAIRSDGALFSWGNSNTLGQLGDGTTISKSSPVQVGTSSWTSVSTSGAGHTLAIRSGGALFSWGRNNSGQLGDGTTIDKSSPVQVGTSSWTLARVSGSSTGNWSHAIRSGGALFAWGQNITFNGGGNPLGDGTNVSKSSPVQVGTSSWTSVSSGFNQVYAIRSDGALFAWGNNNTGQLGDGTNVSKSSPVQIGTSSWTAVAVGGVHGVAITF